MATANLLISDSTVTLESIAITIINLVVNVSDSTSISEFLNLRLVTVATNDPPRAIGYNINAQGTII